MFDDYYDEYVLVARKREWIPELVYRIFCVNLPFFGQPSLIFPFKQLLHREAEVIDAETEEGGDE